MSRPQASGDRVAQISQALRKAFSRHGSVIILGLVLAALGMFLSLRTGSFLTTKNIINVLEANSFRLILAVGMTFVIASGSIDLSVGSVLSLSAIVCAMAMKAGCPVAPAIALCLATGAALGAVNGLLVQVTRVNALIVTLATSLIYRGLALVLTLGTPITRLPAAFRDFGQGDLFGMESGVSMALVICALAFPLLYHMRWGHYLTAIGGNERALVHAGVRSGAYRIGCFAAMGALAALAGIIITARLNSAEPNAGLGMEMDVITAVIMGGTPLMGGSASLAGTVVAVLLLGVIRNGLTLMSISSYYQQLITGVILLASVIVAEIRERGTRRT